LQLAWVRKKRWLAILDESNFTVFAIGKQDNIAWQSVIQTT